MKCKDFFVILSIGVLFIGVAAGYEYPCDGKTFQCTIGNKCFPHNHKCDGEDDCPDGEDEFNCTCQPDTFLCDGLCSPVNLICDGKQDCHDYSDEENCTKDTTEHPVTDGMTSTPLHTTSLPVLESTTSPTISLSQGVTVSNNATTMNPTSNSLSGGVIGGIVVLIVAAVVMVAILCICYRKHKKRTGHVTFDDVESGKPFQGTSESMKDNDKQEESTI